MTDFVFTNWDALNDAGHLHCLSDRHFHMVVIPLCGCLIYFSQIIDQLIERDKEIQQLVETGVCVCVCVILHV